MSSSRCDTSSKRDTQRWTPREREKLRQLAGGSPRKHVLIEQFPGRSLRAIKVRLYKMRRELELPKRGLATNLNPIVKSTTMLHPDDPGIAAPSWQETQRHALERASERYIEALRAA